MSLRLSPPVTVTLTELVSKLVQLNLITSLSIKAMTTNCLMVFAVNSESNTPFTNLPSSILNDPPVAFNLTNLAGIFEILV